MIPAFNACTESPEPGISTSSTVSAIPITSTSLCPAPTVSSRTRSLPAASSRSAACSVASASPPRWPRVPIERMKTPGVEEVVGEPDPVAEQRALRERARRVDRDDADRPARLPHVADERADQRRLADARRAGDADDERRARLRVEVADELVRERVAVLDERDRPRERAPVAARGRRRRDRRASRRGGCSRERLRRPSSRRGASTTVSSAPRR